MNFPPLRPGDRVGLTACSNGLNPANAWQVDQLCQLLASFGLVPLRSRYLFAGTSPYSGTDYQRAAALEAFYQNNSVRAIFDLSGGDLTNGVLNHLDFDLIRRNPKSFFGYSDLSVLLNAIYQKTGVCGCLYSLRNLIREDGAAQVKRFQPFLMGQDAGLTRLHYRFVQGRQMEGVVVGGNLRCFLKLAGTPYFPDLTEKILLLESLGGGLPQIAALFQQLRQMGAFEQVNGVLLGTFTQYQETVLQPSVEELLCTIAENPRLPVAKTEDVGHGPDARCVVIGSRQRFSQT